MQTGGRVQAGTGVCNQTKFDALTYWNVLHSEKQYARSERFQEANIGVGARGSNHIVLREEEAFASDRAPSHHHEGRRSRTRTRTREERWFDGTFAPG